MPRHLHRPFNYLIKTDLKSPNRKSLSLLLLNTLKAFELINAKQKLVIKCCEWAVILVKLAERSLPVAEDKGLNPWSRYYEEKLQPKVMLGWFGGLQLVEHFWVATQMAQIQRSVKLCWTILLLDLYHSSSRHWQFCQTFIYCRLKRKDRNKETKVAGNGPHWKSVWIEGF